jgi:hypothetical protein
MDDIYSEIHIVFNIPVVLKYYSVLFKNVYEKIEV